MFSERFYARRKPRQEVRSKALHVSFGFDRDSFGARTLTRTGRRFRKGRRVVRGAEALAIFG